jgi:uncharacterized protein (DUF849 family)
MLIKACLNGSRKPGDHAALPVTPSELAADARRAVAAGAGALHVHPRGHDGVETLGPGPCDAVGRAIRAACPGVPVGFSTAAWIEPEPERRELIQSWVVRPDFVSVNFSEPGVIELCELVLRLGIGIEAGVWTSADAEAFVDSGHSRHVVRVLVEPQDMGPPEAEAAAAAISAVLDHAGIDAPRVYHGYGMATWRVIEFALDAGWGVRAGLEDTLLLPDGTAASGNAELVAAAVEMARRKGRLPSPRT